MTLYKKTIESVQNVLQIRSRRTAKEVKFKDTNVKFVSTDFKTKREQNNEVKNFGMNTPEENKPWLNLEKNTKEVMCGFVNSLINTR